MEKDKIVLRTYSSTWKFDHKLYSIGEIRLPVPINIDEAAYFIVGLLITLILLKIFPFLNAIPFVVRYILLPYGLMKFLTKKKFDGKLPHKFVIGYLEYLTLPKAFSRFQNCREYKKGRFTSVAFRNIEIVNITEMLTKKERRKIHV